ncbi:MAG: histidine kinase [Ekhidna sp.]
MKKLLSLGRYELAIHGILWLLFFSMANIEWDANWLDRSERTLSPLTFVTFPIFFYANLLWLLPRFFKLKSIWKYILMSIIVTSVPELIRSMLALNETGKAITVFTLNREIWSRDSLLFGAPSPVWFAFLLSCAYFLMKEWINNSKKVEQLEKEKVKMELSLLKSQISPHFIFNSLNTLDGLIEKDSKKARQYLMTLSKVYRFSSANADKDVITLMEEWEFVNNYIGLINERFGGAYEFTLVNNLKDLTKYLIPPSAIQGLVENAIKHNQGDISDPLTIRVECTSQDIAITNRIRPKATATPTSGIGLDNLRNRYLLLVDKEIEVTSEEEFTVKLPLIHQQT